MRQDGLVGVIRGVKRRTTISDPAAIRPPDLVNREFKASRPNELWVVDFTYVSTWQQTAYTAFVTDVYSRRIVGWRCATSMPTDLPLDALEMALDLRARRDEDITGLVHHSDAGSQGGFNWSSQHSSGRSCDGQGAGMGVAADWTAGDAFAGSSACRATGASGAVLGCDRSRCADGGGGRGGGGVGAGCFPVVPRGWRDANHLEGPAVGAISVV